jgi:hypothetical protein
VPALTAGAIAVGLGGIFLFSALILLGTDSTTCDFNGVCTNNAAAAEIGLGVSGGLLVAIGIPLLIYGARRVPVVAVAPGATIPSPLPKWAGAPAAHGWRWQF